MCHSTLPCPYGIGTVEASGECRRRGRVDTGGEPWGGLEKFKRKNGPSEFSVRTLSEGTTGEVD